MAIGKKENPMSSPEPALAISGLTKRYGRVEAVSSLTLSAMPGEIYAFLGPNGAGKTTTLRCVAGLLLADAGSIEVCGFKVQPDAIPFREVLAYVQDRPYLYEKLTAWEYLEFLASARGLKGWHEKAERFLGLFGLSDWRHALVEGFSHGMRQKLALTGALLHEPRLLMVDEPMVGLDPRSSRDVRQLFKALAGSGVCLFLSTHSLDMAQAVADRIGILHKGRLVAEGTFAQLQALSHQPDSSLEEVFIRLTEDSLEDTASKTVAANE
jgi:ABC-2 type transport system ATP-binding protein